MNKTKLNVCVPLAVLAFAAPSCFKFTTRLRYDAACSAYDFTAARLLWLSKCAYAWLREEKQRSIAWKLLFMLEPICWPFSWTRF